MSNVRPHMEASSQVTCPCCGYFTLGARGNDEICPVCYWQDDGQDEQSAAEVWGGPNKDISLEQARANYMSFGAAHREWVRYVRLPRAGELLGEV
jgi:hypothetical protein